SGYLGNVRPMTNTKARRPSKYNKDWKSKNSFVLTGHKSAGAVAAVLGMILKEQGYEVRETVTFGMPKFLSAKSAKFWNSKLRLTRIVNENDLTPQTPVDLIRTPLTENWAHFGREIVLCWNGGITEQPTIGLNDSFFHQLLLNPTTFLNYLWRNGSFGEIHHPALTHDKHYSKEPLANDYTDALLLCLYNIQTAKNNRVARSPTRSNKSHKLNRPPSLFYLAIVILLQTFLNAFGFFKPIPSTADDSEISLSSSLTEGIDLRRIKIESAYMTIYQDNVIHGNSAAPSTKGSANHTWSENIGRYQEQQENGVRCADCLLFRRENFVKTKFGALIVHPLRAEAMQNNNSRKIKTFRSDTRMKKATEESIKNARSKDKITKNKNNIKYVTPLLPAQRSAVRDWTRQRMVA
ncbi:hypothetical protein HK096_008817, partial [Nowakowskiella sp. JEL0078]